MEMPFTKLAEARREMDGDIDGPKASLRGAPLVARRDADGRGETGLLGPARGRNRNDDQPQKNGDRDLSE
jgi:hypothetical protein